MKITAITIENFKGISEPVRVELKPITLLFGANSVGKSTIVQALHYVREILERNNVDADRCLGADESLDLGGFRNLVHNHDLTRSIRIKIEMSMDYYEFPDYMVLNEDPASTHGIDDAIGMSAEGATCQLYESLAGELQKILKSLFIKKKGCRILMMRSTPLTCYLSAEMINSSFKN